jgi:murein DD-endopeptidase MepM/ murein hydrolase activator NlpD
MSKPVLAILVSVLGLGTVGAVGIFVRAILAQGPLPGEAAASTHEAVKNGVEEVQGAFYVGADLATSYRGVFQDGILDAVDEALGSRLPTDSLKEGGAVRIIAHARYAAGKLERYEDIAAVEYRSPEPGARPVRFYAFTGREARGFFDEQGRQPIVNGWLSPVPGARRTSKFNPKRLHPILHKVMPHQGTDFGAPKGTPVYAVFHGVVDWVGPKGPLGNWVSIIHPNGVETGYAHLSKIAPGLKHGDKIATHQLVGYVGSTGRSTGPHLHFSARKDGEFFDAETLLTQGEREMPEIDRAAFVAAKAALDRRLEAIPLPGPPAAKAPAQPAAPAQGPDERG